MTVSRTAESNRPAGTLVGGLSYPDYFLPVVANNAADRDQYLEAFRRAGSDLGFASRRSFQKILADAGLESKVPI